MLVRSGRHVVCRGGWLGATRIGLRSRFLQGIIFDALDNLQHWASELL